MFIQIIQGRCSREDEMRAHTQKWLDEIAPGATGWLGGTYGIDDDGVAMAVVRFESREAAEANAARPEQSAWWAEMERLFEGPVEFHDCDRVLLMMDGGSDEAGFVQVIQGRLEDPDALESGLHDMETMLHEARPEILGSTFAIEPDGSFTETVWFTDEESAREREQAGGASDEKAREAMQAWERMVHDVRYHDLHRPWFASRWG